MTTGTTGGVARDGAPTGALTGEEIERRFPNEASDGVRYSNLRVLCSAAGHYIGRTSWELGFPFEQPYSRESAYFATEAEASVVLLGGEFHRGCIENEVAREVGDLPRVAWDGVSEAEGAAFEAFVESAAVAEAEAEAEAPAARGTNAPRIVSRKSLARSAAKRWFKQYKRDIERGTGQPYVHFADGTSKQVQIQAPKQVHERLLSLGSDPNPDDVVAIVGNKSWVCICCDACRKDDVPFVIRVGDVGSTDREANFVDLCTGCLHLAMVTMDEALAKHETRDL